MKVKIKTEFCPTMLKTLGKLSFKCMKGMQGRKFNGVSKSSTVTELAA